MKEDDTILLFAASFVTTLGLMAVYFEPHPFLFLIAAVSLTVYMTIWDSMDEG